MASKSSYTLAFFAHAHNLAEVTRAVEIARVLSKKEAEITFFTHGGPHENIINEGGFPLITLQPIITQEKHESLIGIEQGRKFHPPFKAGELSAYVEHEVAELRKLQPKAVYFGMNLPCAISARVLRLPLIEVLPAPVMKTYFEHGLGTYPESHEKFLFRFLPHKLKDRLFNRFMLHFRIGLGAFNQVGRRYGLRPFQS